MKVFISSTSEDLKPYRLAAADVIRDAQWVPVGMEHFPADSRPIVQLCRDEIGKCNLVILLQAFRRGWVPEPEKGGDGQASITAIEIAAADELRVPVLSFLADENWPGRLWDDDPIARAWAKNFRNGLNRNAKFFRWEEDPKLPLFRALLSQELANYRMRGVVPHASVTATTASVALRTVPAESPLPPEPYPLLGPYEHPRTFAGRDADIARLATLVRLPPLVLCVHAPSGAGKSSLLLAGLAPRLRADGFAVSVERAPGDAGLAQRLLRDLLELPESVAIDDGDADLPAEFARWIAHVHALSGKPAVLVLDQFDDVLRSAENRDQVLARIGPLLAATAQRLPIIQGFAAKWVLCYRHEFHGEVRGWLEDVLAQARTLGREGLALLPHDLSDAQKSHDWVLPVMGKPAPGDQGEEHSKRAFLQAIMQPLSLVEGSSSRYHYVMPKEGAERLATVFAQARQAQPDAPLVPELQVVLNYLLQRAGGGVSSGDHGGPVTVEVPPAEYLDAEIKHALANHLERALSSAFPEGRDPAASRLARTRALLALRELADAEGRRSEGLPRDELVSMLGPDGEALLTRLSSPETRLVITTSGLCTLSHDRLAEVVTDVVRNEAVRGNLLLDQSLIDLQRAVGQKLALYQSDATDKSALALTRHQRGLIESNRDTLLFDTARQSWWDASERYRWHLHSKRRRWAAAAVSGVVLMVLSVLLPPELRVHLEIHPMSRADWVVKMATAVSAVPEQGMVVWRLGEPWSQRKRSGVQCERFEVSPTADYLAGITADGNLYVWPTADPMTLDSTPVLSGLPRWVETSELLLQFSPDGRWVSAAMPNGEIYVWNPAQRAAMGHRPLIRVAPVDWRRQGLVVETYPSRMTFSPRGKWLAVKDGDYNLFVLRPGTDVQQRATPVAVTSPRSGPVFSDDDQWMVWTDAKRRDSRRPEAGVAILDSLSVWRIGTSERFTINPPPALVEDAQSSESQRRPTSYFVQFSPGARWLVGRRWSEPFITWDIGARVTSVGVLAAGAVAGNGFEIFPIWFSPNGEWVAGVANDGKLHLWQPWKPPGLNRPLFPDEYSDEVSPSFVFNSQGTRAAAVAPKGALHVWSLGPSVDIGPAVAHLYEGAEVRFSGDGDYVYSADTRNVYLGRAGHEWSWGFSSTSAVQVVAVTPDRSRLAIFAKNEVNLAERKRYVWGIPLWSLKWPALAEPLEVEE